jgi:hypothetical protein
MVHQGLGARPLTGPICSCRHGSDACQSRPNKYASRYVPGSVVVVLDPDVAATFGTSKEANEALRALAGIIAKRRARRPSSK